MELFADDAVLATLEASLAAEGVHSPADQVALAWHLRQRDTRRALTLADDVAARLGWAAADNTCLLARLDLLRGEAALLFTRFDEAAGLIDTAQAAFESAGDLVGMGDCHLTASLLANAGGDSQAHLARAGQALACYRQADDEIRQAIAAAWCELAEVYADPTASAHKQAGPPDPLHTPVAAQVLRGMAEGVRLFNGGEYAQAAIDFAQMITPAASAGMMLWRIRIGNTLSAALANLDDRESALHWVEQTLALARSSGWPVALGDTLALLGSLAREAGQLDRSIALLAEAVGWLKPVPNSRSMAMANCYLSQTELAAGQFQRALQHAGAAERIGAQLGTHAIVADARILAGRAHAGLGDGETARREVLAGLTLTEQHQLPFWQVGALRALAEIDEAFPTPDSSPLPHLEHALEVVTGMGGHSENVALLEALSRAYEQVGNLARALDCNRQARAKASNAENRRVANQLIALALRHKTEQQRIEAEYQRTLADAQIARARELEASMQVLENLGRIGREITANLHVGNVLQTLVSNLGRLTQVNYVGISVLEPNGKEMVGRGVENGLSVPDRRLALDHPNSQAARCAREQREILVEHKPGEVSASHVPGTQVVLASWFGPLMVGDELLGVLTIQSAIEHAYGPREQLIFRTLSAYVAVAVANARAYTKLGEQHTRLLKVEAEMRRLATTDALTGIPNRRQFLTALSSETRRSQRSQRPLAVIMADIDHFKLVNDTLGHAAGDAVLVEVARLLNLHKRAIDTVGRLGGEEFAILLPETSADQAAEVADRLRGLIEARQVEWQGTHVPVTMSFGCAGLEGRHTVHAVEQAATEMLQAADRALYQAKHAGRNRTVLLRDGQAEMYTAELDGSAG
ncbi:sensor domain-containing diguanylate cyclase [Chitinimonas arctica]|nr:sensor domain-containing diguanylate cyclase [Chitinimonas arctica]